MKGAFMDMALSVADDEVTQNLFKEDTGKDLKSLMICNSKELVCQYLDWVAMRYWGVECEILKESDKSSFMAVACDLGWVTSSFDIVANGESFCIKSEGGIVALCLVKSGYIIFIGTLIKGLGSHLMNFLPEGKYEANILTSTDEDERRARRLFEKFGFKSDGGVNYAGHILKKDTL